MLYFVAHLPIYNPIPYATFQMVSEWKLEIDAEIGEFFKNETFAKCNKIKVMQAKYMILKRDLPVPILW